MTCNMGKKYLLLSTALCLLIGSVFVLRLVTNEETREFDLMVEALAEGEQEPGEAENCEESNQHCYYSFNGKHYNIERHSNKR